MTRKDNDELLAKFKDLVDNGDLKSVLKLAVEVNANDTNGVNILKAGAHGNAGRIFNTPIEIRYRCFDNPKMQTISSLIRMLQLMVDSGVSPDSKVVIKDGTTKELTYVEYGGPESDDTVKLYVE